MASFLIVGDVTATDNCIFTLEKMWLQITILRPHVVLKDLFDVKSFSANNCTVPRTIDGKAKSA